MQFELLNIVYVSRRMSWLQFETKESSLSLKQLVEIEIIVPLPQDFSKNILGNKKGMKRKIMVILCLLVHFYSCSNISVNS